MNANKLGSNLILLGLVLLLIAVGWWAWFYGPLVHQVHSDLNHAFTCLYSNEGLCAVTTSIAQFAGKTPYSPLIAWAGAACAVVGVLLKLSTRN